MATGEGSETIYMVTRGDHVNGGCCFDYGNAETDNDDDGKGTMEALYFGTSNGWGRGQGNGPGSWRTLRMGCGPATRRSAKSDPSRSVGHRHGQGSTGRLCAQGWRCPGGTLLKLYEGKRPVGYDTMKKQGAIILGTGGDNSCHAVSTFYEAP